MNRKNVDTINKTSNIICLLFKECLAFRKSIILSYVSVVNTFLIFSYLRALL